MLEELKKVVELLVKNKPVSCKNTVITKLKGNHKGIRELHLKPDDLLLYIKKGKEKNYTHGTR